MLTLQKITKRLPNGKVLFEDVEIVFGQGRYGLTGPNGSGKSTLMKIMMEIDEPTSGQIHRPDKVGFLKQNIEAFADYKVLDVVLMGNPKLWAALSKRDELYEQEMTDEIGMELANLEEVIADENGYTADSDAEALLTGIGIPAEMHESTMSQVPQDMQFRALLCQALFGEPEVLLLDEPTNHLDLESIGWLEQFLMQFEGTLIITSHDRHFLNSVTNQIADIDYETIIVYPGNYDAMIAAKSQIRAKTEHENKSKAKKVEQLKSFISKFQAGTRASQVKSRLKEVEKLQPSELKKSNIERPYIRFVPPPRPSGKIVLKAHDLCKSFDDNKVISDFSIEIDLGDKIGIIGNNGLGKTTLLKLLCEQLEPTSGSVEMGFRVEKAYFPQNHEEILDIGDETAFDYLKRQKEGCYDQEIRDVLGKMLFPGEDVFKPLKALSGGERARLILAGHMLREPNTLFFDEPNNHLDLESVSALCHALKTFEGTVLLAAHDRSLINEVANKIISFTDTGVDIFLGTLDEYLEAKTV